MSNKKLLCVVKIISRSNACIFFPSRKGKVRSGQLWDLREQPYWV